MSSGESTEQRAQAVLKWAEGCAGWGPGGRSRPCPRTARSAGLGTVPALHACGGISSIKHTDPAFSLWKKQDQERLHVLIERDCQAAVRVS